MRCRWANLGAPLLLLGWLSLPGIVAAQQPAKPDTRPVLEITQNTTLDPAKTYGHIVIKASGITINGAGAWLIGATAGDPKDYTGVGISAKDVSNVTLKNLNVKGWETGLKIQHGSHFTVENCNFSDNFHWPAYGWAAWATAAASCWTRRSFHLPQEQGQPRLGRLHADQFRRQRDRRQ